MGGRSFFRTERGLGPAWAEPVRVWPKLGDRWGAPGSLRPRLTRKVGPLPGPAGACSSQSALGRPGTAACAESISARFQRRNRLRRPILPSTGSAEEKADSTLRSSRAVPHPSTNRALRRLTSEVRRDPVHSTRYGRQRTLCLAKRSCLGGPSYQASVPWSLDAVMCCVAVCYHKYMDA